MSKSRNERKKARAVKRQKWGIDNRVAQMPSGLISPEVALNQETEEIKEKISITFKDYKQKTCELSRLVEPNAKKLVFVLKKLCNLTKKELPQAKIIKDKIERSKHYNFLYENLSPDVELVEIDFGDKERIFGHFVQNYFCIVLIKTEHIK